MTEATAVLDFVLEMISIRPYLVPTLSRERTSMEFESVIIFEELTLVLD